MSDADKEAKDNKQVATCDPVDSRDLARRVNVTDRGIIVVACLNVAAVVLMEVFQGWRYDSLVKMHTAQLQYIREICGGRQLQVNDNRVNVAPPRDIRESLAREILMREGSL